MTKETLNATIELLEILSAASFGDNNFSADDEDFIASNIHSVLWELREALNDVKEKSNMKTW